MSKDRSDESNDSGDSTQDIYYGIVGLFSIVATPFFIMDEMGGWTFTNILLFPIYCLFIFGVLIFFFFVTVKIPYIIFLRSPYRFLTGKSLIQKNICPFCDKKVAGWFSSEHEQCRKNFLKELDVIQKNISKTINHKKTPEFKGLVNNTSDIFQRYIHTNEGKKYVIQILAGELKNIRTSLDAQISNKFSISIAQYFETNKDLLLKEFNQESVISEALTYSFDKVMTSKLDDFLIDDQELKDIEDFFQSLEKIHPLNLSNLDASNRYGIVHGNQLYRIKNDLELNKIDLPPGILLQKNEIPIVHITNVKCHFLNIKTKYRGRSTGGSYRLSSKLTIRHSEHRGRPVSYSEWDSVGGGELVLTNKHIYFLGNGSARDHKEKLSNIISYDPTSDGFIVNLNFKTRPAVRYQMNEHDAFYCTNMLSLAQ